MPAAEKRCVCERLAVVTEGAALEAAKWMGRGDGLAADKAAREAMASILTQMPIRGRVVAGRGGGGSEQSLRVNDKVGDRAGQDEQSDLWDIVVDPLQAPMSLARGTDGAMTTLAAGPAGSLMAVPEMYMEKIVVPSGVGRAVDLDAPVAKNIKAVAEALDRAPDDLIVVVLDRPRHEELAERIRGAGARVRLIRDGDISASIAVATRDASVDMYIGIGGSTEGILTAAALRSLGGEIQARFWPVSRHQVEQAKALGIEDIEAKLTTADMAGEGVLMVATAVTGGRFLRAVDFRPDGTRTETIVLCSACHAVRKIMTIHRSSNEGPRLSLGAR
jgi:fructose-1,6-bisphosphatase II